MAEDLDGDGDGIPPTFYQGTAVSDGDCFFDSVAQTLGEITSSEVIITVKSLRRLCQIFAINASIEEQQWLIEALKSDLENYTIEEYALRIWYTADEIRKQPTLALLLCLKSPVWGRAEVEGQIICKKYNVKLHLIEKHEVNGTVVWVNQLISPDKTCACIVDWEDKNIIHILNNGDLHFVPILRRPNLFSSEILNEDMEVGETSELVAKLAALQGDFDKLEVSAVNHGYLGGVILNINCNDNMQFVLDSLSQQTDAVAVEINCGVHKPSFIVNDEFINALKNMENLVMVNVINSENFVVDDQNVKHLLNLIEQPLIIQCVSLTNTLAYFKNRFNVFVKIDLNGSSNEETFYKDVANIFEFSSVVDGLNLGLLGEFSICTPQKSLLDVKANEWQSLVTMALAIKQNNLLILKYSLLFLYHIESIDVCKDEISKLLATKDSVLKENQLVCNKIFLALNKLSVTSVEKENLNAINVLIRTGCVNVNEKLSHELLSHYAFRNQKYEALLLLLKNDSEFSKNFSADKTNNEDLKQLVKDRNNLHDKISNGDFECLNLIEKLDKSKFCLNSRNESALLTAIENKQFDIYASLQSLGLKFKDDSEACVIKTLEANEKARLKRTIEKQFPKCKMSPVFYLLSKSKKRGEMDNRSIEKFKMWYEELLKIETVDIILSVVENCDYLNIMYDFDNKTICGMDPTVPGNIKGLTCHAEGRIFIGAMADDAQVLGTVIHELTHLAMQMVYNNDCNPFAATDRAGGNEQKLKIDQISLAVNEKLKNEPNNMDKIWKGAFLDGEHCWSKELIARVPQMLAMYVDGDDILNNETESLFNFYKTDVIPKCKEFIDDSYYIKVRSTIDSVNNLSGLTIILNQLNIKFLNPFNVCNRSNNKKLLLVVTSSTFLTIASIYQGFRNLSPSAFLMFNFKYYISNKLDIYEMLKFEVCNFLIIELMSKEEEEITQAEIGQFRSFIRNNPSKRIVVIVEKLDDQQREQQLKTLRASSVVDKITLEDYSLSDFVDEFQNKLLEKDVLFQGNKVKFGILIDKDCFNLVKSEIITKLINDEVLIGKKPPLSYDYDESLYVERKFTLSSDSELSEIELVDKLSDCRLVIISSVAGMGKTTILTKLTTLIKNHWLIRIDLNCCIKELSNELKSRSFTPFNISNALQFLINKLLDSREQTKLETQFERDLLAYFINNNKNVIVMLDGFDEICPDYECVIIELIAALLNSNLKQLWLTTRPQQEEKLYVFKLKKSPKLLPFTQPDQVNFIIKYWTKTYNFSKEVEQYLKFYAETLVDSLSKSISDTEKCFTGIPLQTKLLAVSYGRKVNTLIKLGKIDYKFSVNINLVELYEGFIKEKFILMQEEKQKIERNHPITKRANELLEKQFFIEHQIASVFSLFDDDVPNKLLLEEEKEMGLNLIACFKMGSENSGLISQIYSGRPQYVHRTFAEYLASKFFIQNMLKANASNVKNEVIIFLFTELLYHEMYNIITVFLNQLLGKLKVNKVALENYGRHVLFRASAFPGVLYEAFRNNNPNIAWFILNCFPICYKSLEILNLTGELIGDLCKKDYDEMFRSCHDIQSVRSQYHQNIHLIKSYLRHEDINGRMPLHWAAFHGSLSLVRLIVSHFLIVGADISEIIEIGDKRNTTAFLWAVNSGNLDVVKYLVYTCKSNVHAVNYIGNTAVILAASKGDKDLMEYIIKDCKCDVKVKNILGNAPLHIIIQGRYLHLLKLLFLNGADVHATNFYKQTPLHLAAGYGIFECVKCLIENCNAAVNAVSNDGLTTIHLAAISGNEDLIDYLIDVCNCRVDGGEESLCTPLHVAAEHGTITTIDYLVKQYGVDINESAKDGRKALHFAAVGGEIEVVKHLLTNYQVDLQATCNSGKTLMHYAAAKGHTQFIDYLMQHHLEINTPDNDNKTPLDEARSAGNLALVRHLQQNYNAHFYNVIQ
ncbi:hypothetical protein CHUAL_007070 [Chamberlinius hualienensis]